MENIEEIREILKTDSGNLSLLEMLHMCKASW